MAANAWPVHPILITCASCAVIAVAAYSVIGDMRGSHLEAARVEQSTVLWDDFESRSLGPLGAPWSNSKAGNSQANVSVTSDHGKVLLLQGGTAVDYLNASRTSASSSTEITAKFDVRPNGGASFIWSLSGAGDSIGARRIRLQREPGSTMLRSNTVPGGNRNCADLASNVWSTVALIVHATTLPHTFDVLINGASTGCTGLPTGLSQPFTHIDVMDAGNEGWGGDVRFDNFSVTAP